MAAATPCLDHVEKWEWKDVYEPAEDTYLFLDALLSEKPRLDSIQPLICLEIGCGSGCVTAFLRQTVGPNASYFCTDINPAAARVARKTLVLHDALQHSDVILTDLQSAIASRLKNSVDVLLFNPPYVPTPDEEVHKGGIYASWAGGVDGRVVTDRLLPLVSDLLSPKGIFYLIALEENKPKDIAKIMARYGFQGAIVAKRGAGIEQLYVLRFIRKQEPAAQPSNA